MLALMPWAIATLATDAPGSSHSASTCAFCASLYRRLVFLSLVIASTYRYVDSILVVGNPSFKMTLPDAYDAPAVALLEVVLPSGQHRVDQSRQLVRGSGQGFALSIRAHSRRWGT
jgi:hypothetical protein